MNPTMKIVRDIGRMNLEGNIIPHNWYCNLKFKNGKPHVNACVLLSEIVYWYRPTIVKDEATGKVIEEKKKFKADKLQRSYASFSEQFGFTKRQVKDALKFLEKKGVITLEFRHINLPNGTRLANVLYIEPVGWMLHNITFQRHTCDDTTSDPLPFNGTDVTIEGQTNTDTTTDIESISIRDEAGKMTPETELAMLTEWGRQGRGGVADPSQDSAQWIKYGDGAVNVFVENGGDLGRKVNQQQPRIEAIKGFVTSFEDFDMDRWRDSCHSAIIIGGVNGDNLACIFDTYKQGGDYQAMYEDRRKAGGNGNRSNTTGSGSSVRGSSLSDEQKASIGLS